MLTKTLTSAPLPLPLSPQAGSVVDIKLITDKNSGKSKGMAYVELQRAEDMLAASTLAGEAGRAAARRCML
jgi:hypothetical protein